MKWGLKWITLGRVSSLWLPSFVYLPNPTLHYSPCIQTYFFSPTANSLTAYVCCYVLGEYFKVPSLPLESLAHVRELLTVQNALVLTQFAESIHSQALHDICVQFLQANQQQR